MGNAFPLPELPSAAAIDLWQIDLDEPSVPEERLTRLLTQAERDRAARFVQARDRARFSRCRAMLRLGLGWLLRRNPGDIALLAGAQGKPRLAGEAKIFFNVSHAQGLGLIAFTAAGEVGVDVESADRVVEAGEIASAYFTPREAAQIAAASTPAQQSLAFLRLWTRKEAVLKAAGFGIPLGLERLDVSSQTPAPVWLDESQAGRSRSCWRLADVAMPPGLVAAVAAPPGDWAVEVRRSGCRQAVAAFEARFPGWV